MDLNEISSNDCYEVKHEKNELFSNDNISEMSKAFKTKYTISPKKIDFDIYTYDLKNDID